LNFDLGGVLHLVFAIHLALKFLELLLGSLFGMVEKSVETLDRLLFFFSSSKLSLQIFDLPEGFLQLLRSLGRALS